jgi:hypothetical protein
MQSDSFATFAQPSRSLRYSFINPQHLAKNEKLQTYINGDIAF